MSAFDKIVGYKEIKRELMQYADILKDPEKYRKLGVSIPNGIMLIGKPGLGKTLMAKCFAEESGCSIYIIRKNKSDGEFVNLIRETYAKARENAPAVVILDDLDKYANEDPKRCDAEEYVTVQACIDEHREAGVFSFATVNNEFCLPESLKRAGRFDEIIQVKKPRGEDAREIISYYLEQKKTIANVDGDEIYRILEGKSCADIENVINRAGIYAGFSGRNKIEQQDLINAFLRTQFQFMDGEKTEGIAAKTVAIHEAGHAIVHEVLDPGSVNIVSIGGCGGGEVQGVVRFNFAEEYPHSKMLHDHKIMGVLGGKAASEVVSGEVDMGCNSDLVRAFEMADEYVDDICAFGFDAFERSRASDDLLNRKEQLRAAELEHFYFEAKRIIIENRAFLDALVDALLDHKTVTYREMQELREKYVQGNRLPNVTDHIGQ